MRTVVVVGDNDAYYTTNQLVSFRVVNGTRVFKILPCRSRLIAPLHVADGAVFVLSLSWQETADWPKQTAEFARGISNLHPSSIYITTTNFHSVVSAVSVLSPSVDKCHQYLRVIALKWGACLAYAHTPTDIQSMFKKNQPVSFYGSIVYVNNIDNTDRISADTGDSKERIMAVDAEFEFELAYANELELPPLCAAPERRQQRLDLAAEMQKITAEHVETGSLAEPVILKDDSEVISEFFSKLVRST